MLRNSSISNVRRLIPKLFRKFQHAPSGELLRFRALVAINHQTESKHLSDKNQLVIVDASLSKLAIAILGVELPVSDAWRRLG